MADSEDGGCDLARDSEQGVVARVTQSVILMVICLLTVADNALLWVTVLRYKEFHKIMYVLLLSLSASDVVMGVFNMPLMVYTIYVGRREYSCGVCRASSLTFSVCLCSNVTSLCAVSVNRYIRVCQERWYSTIYRSSTVGMHVAVPWVLALSLGVVELADQDNIVFDSSLYFCLWRSQSTPGRLSLVAFILAIAVIIVGCNTAIYHKCWRSARKMRRHETRSLKVHCAPSVRKAGAEDREWKAQHVSGVTFVRLALSGLADQTPSDPDTESVSSIWASCSALGSPQASPVVDDLTQRVLRSLPGGFRRGSTTLDSGYPNSLLPIPPMPPRFYQQRHSHSTDPAVGQSSDLDQSWRPLCCVHHVVSLHSSDVGPAVKGPSLEHLGKRPSNAGQPLTSTSDGDQLLTLTPQEGHLLTPTFDADPISTLSSDVDRPLTQSFNEDPVLTRSCNAYQQMSRTFNNDQLLTQTSNNDPQLTQTSSNDQPLTQSSNNDPQLTQTSNNDPQLTQTSKNDQLLTQTSNNDLQLTQTSNNDPQLTQTSNNDQLLTQTSNNDPKLTQTSNNDQLLTQTSNNDLQLTQTSNNDPQLTQTSNNDPQLTQTSNNDPQLTQSSNNDPQLTQTSNNDPLWTQTSDNDQLLTETSNNDPQLAQTSNNEPQLTQTSNNDQLLTQTSYNDQLLTQTSYNDQLLTQTSYNDQLTQTSYNDQLTQPSYNDQLLTQPSYNDQLLTQTSDMDAILQWSSSVDPVYQSLPSMPPPPSMPSLPSMPSPPSMPSLPSMPPPPSMPSLPSMPPPPSSHTKPPPPPSEEPDIMESRTDPSQPAAEVRKEDAFRSTQRSDQESSRTHKPKPFHPAKPYRDDVYVALTVMTVVGLFLVTYLPNVIILIVLTVTSVRVSPTVVTSLVLLLYLNSVCNPIIYGWGNLNIRTGCKRLLAWVLCKLLVRNFSHPPA